MKLIDFIAPELHDQDFMPQNNPQDFYRAFKLALKFEFFLNKY